MFDNNVGKCGQISIFIHQLMRKKIQDKELHLQYIITLPLKYLIQFSIDYDKQFLN